jgi:uncharacterized membrane protein
MLRSLIIGFISGARSLSPVAVASLAARRGRLAVGGGPAGLLAGPKVSAGLGALAIGEALGDKMQTAPDRIVPAGMAVRLVTAALAGAAVAPAGDKRAGAVAGVGAAIIGSYLTFAARMRSMERHGQTETGVVEDLLVLVAGLALVGGAGHDQRRFARGAFA